MLLYLQNLKFSKRTNSTNARYVLGTYNEE